MRCPKCGFVSFDYLARCKKCSRDLEDARRALNLVDAKPAVPFLLGSLVGAAVHGAGREGLSALSLTQETELEISSLNMGVSSHLDDTREKTRGAQGGSIEPPSVPRETESPSFELSLDDLATEQGHGGGQAPAKGQDGGIPALEIEMDEAGPGAVAGDLTLDENTPEAIAKEFDLDVDLKEREFSTLSMELDRPTKPGPAPKSTASDEPMPELEAALLEMEKEL